MGEEGRESNEGENNSNEKNHPLSREGWIMLLCGEIDKEEMKLTTYWNACIVILIAFLSAEVAFLVARFQSGVVIHYILVLAMFIFLGLTVIYYKCYLYPSLQERLKPLINLREAIISGELTDFGEIHGIWKEYIKKYYRMLLAKSEMDKEEKESKGEKDGSKGKRIWEKAMKSRKKSRKSLTRDIRDIKESLQEIKDVMEVTKFFNLFCVVGSLFVVEDKKELKEGEEDSKMRKIKTFLAVIVIVLLIAPAMLAPLWVALFVLFIIIPLFAIACILQGKLRKNEKAISQIRDGFGNVIIGIISGLVASCLMWVLVTFDKTLITLTGLTFIVWAVVTLLVVAFSLVVVWVFLATQR